MATASQPVPEPALLDWRDAIPISRRFDDPYFSLAGGLEETRHVFLAGNRLDTRLCDGFQIAELGFGSGLNLLATLQLWRQMGCAGTLHFTSFEAFPMALDDMARVHAAFPEVAEIAEEFRSHWSDGQSEVRLPGLEMRLILGDARATLPRWTGAADAWFLDGFSPAKNPELWSADLMRQVAGHTRPGGTLATYTAAGHVRRALAEAGFAVTRQPGYARKRHMTTGLITH